MPGCMAAASTTINSSICRYQPAKIFGLFPRKGTIAVGSDGDVVIFDPQGETFLLPHMMNIDYNMYEGMRVRGTADEVLLRGKPIVRERKYVGGNLGTDSISPGNASSIRRCLPEGHMYHPHGPTVWELVAQGLSSTERGYDLLAPKFDYAVSHPEAILTAALSCIGGAGALATARCVLWHRAAIGLAATLS